MIKENKIWDTNQPRVGQRAERTREVSSKDIELFTSISGDKNPLHYNEEFAKATKFGEIIVQGGITSAILNAVVAEDLPGSGSVFLHVDWDFKAPVRPGDKILVHKFNKQQFLVVIEWLGSMHIIHNLISEINLGTGRITEIVKVLKTYTYMDQAPIQSVDVHEGLNNTLIILQNKLKKGITVRREYAAKVPIIQAYGSELNQVWTNIIDNAIDAMTCKGTLILRTRVEQPWVIIEIEDNGPGISETIQNNIFDPFFTTKPPGKGTGLGLNISHNIIVKKHQGQIAVSSEPGRTCFFIRLPIKGHLTDKSWIRNQNDQTNHHDNR
jgi:signal transduction histidine kinase